MDTWHDSIKRRSKERESRLEDLEKYPWDPVILNKCYHNKIINVIYYWFFNTIFYDLSKIIKARLNKIVKVHLSPLKKSY